MTPASPTRIVRLLVAALLLAASPGPLRAEPLEVRRDPERGLVLGDGRPLVLAAIRPAIDDSDLDAALDALLTTPLPWDLDPVTTDWQGRVRAQARRADGTWLQQSLVRAGRAIVVPEPGHETALPALLAAEAEARTARRGAWAGPEPPLAEAGAAARLIGRHAIVDAVVTRAVRREHEILLDTGADWRRDFTVRIARFELPAWKAAGRDPGALEGRRIRVRGLVFWSAGPMIDVVVPEQVEELR
jgi:hypothetical protein